MIAYAKIGDELICLNKIRKELSSETLMGVYEYEALWDINVKNPIDVLRMVFDAGVLGVNYYRLWNIINGYDIPIETLINFFLKGEIKITNTTDGKYNASITYDGKQWNSKSDDLLASGIEVYRNFITDVPEAKAKFEERFQ